MNPAQIKLLYTILFFLLIFLSGFWLSRKGKPYHAGLFNVHKLIGLAAGIFLIVTVYQVHKSMPFYLAQVAMLVITVLIFIINVAAGGLLSVIDSGGLKNMKPFVHRVILLVHQVFPYLAVLATLMTLYLLVL